MSGRPSRRRSLGIVGYFDLLPGAHELLTRYGRATGPFKDPNVFGPFLVPALVYALQPAHRRAAAQEHSRCSACCW